MPIEGRSTTRCCPSHAREADVRALFVFGQKRTIRMVEATTDLPCRRATTTGIAG
jgi:hypothetical protein